MTVIPRKSLCDPHSAGTPDIKQVVDRILAFFSVYTGAVLTFFVKDFLFAADNIKLYPNISDWLDYWGLWITLAVVALLLRYILGTAAHLNYTYIAKNQQIIKRDIIQTSINPATYKSRSVCWLFFDLLFIIVFGILVMLITRATDTVSVIMWHALYFLFGGFVWSVIAAFARKNERRIGVMWMIVDGLQIVLTLAVLGAPFTEFAQAVILGSIYVLFLFADLYCIVRWSS
jgi:hypothetical protein